MKTDKNHLYIGASIIIAFIFMKDNFPKSAVSRILIFFHILPMVLELFAREVNILKKQQKLSMAYLY
jgi:hypothetical protein